MKNPLFNALKPPVTEEVGKKLADLGAGKALTTIREATVSGGWST